MRKRAWTPGLVPDPSNRSRTLTLDGCVSAERFDASLRDESWAEYSRAIYGEPASATQLQNLELFRGVALHTLGHKVSDRRPLRCGLPAMSVRSLQRSVLLCIRLGDGSKVVSRLSPCVARLVAFLRYWHSERP